ncbi:hypothetical protein D3C81_1787100 [compost metagenome]
MEGHGGIYGGAGPDAGPEGSEALPGYAAAPGRGGGFHQTQLPAGAVPEEHADQQGQQGAYCGESRIDPGIRYLRGAGQGAGHPHYGCGNQIYYGSD